MEKKSFIESFIAWLSHRSFKSLYALSDFVYPILYYLVGYRKKVVRKNLKNSFPTWSEQELRALEKKFYRSFCDIVVESVKMYSISEEEMKEHFRVTNLEEIERMHQHHRSYFVLLGHYGCWEWGAAYPLVTGSTEVMMIYKKLTDATFDDIMLRMRSRFKALMIEDKHLLRTLVQRRKEEAAKGKSNPLEIGFLVDQSPEPNSLRYWTQFMNQDTAVLDSTERMARKLGFGMVYYDMKKIGRGQYEVTLVPMSDNVAETPEFAMTEMYTRLMEKTILRAPENYLWSHNRWKYSNSHEKN